MPTAKKAAEAPPAADPGEETLAPTPHQLREVHAILRDHGITTDDAIYAYLGSVLGRDITSRKSVARTEMARIIADLREHPYKGMTPERSAALRAPFPDDQIGKLPRGTCKACRESQRKRCDNHQWVSNCPACGGNHSSATIHLDYVGHADLTNRLLEVDPNWTWRPFTEAEILALPPKYRADGLWIMLTVCGVTRPGYGDADGKSGGSAIKEAIGDALRNGGMRFGVALDLWAKGDRDFSAHAAATDDDDARDREADRGASNEWRTNPVAADPWASPPATDSGPSDDLDDMGVDDLLLVLDKMAESQGKTYSDFTQKWRDSLGGLDVDNLDTLPRDVIAAYIRKVRAFFAGAQS